MWDVVWGSGISCLSVVLCLCLSILYRLGGIVVRHPPGHRLIGLVVKASASRAEDPGLESRLRRDFFRGRVIPVTSKLALQWLPCQTPGVIGSVLGLVGPVSIYCDWVRWKVWSATSVSV